jgi:hypothetical protein
MLSFPDTLLVTNFCDQQRLSNSVLALMLTHDCGHEVLAIDPPSASPGPGQGMWDTFTIELYPLQVSLSLRSSALKSCRTTANLLMRFEPLLNKLIFIHPLIFNLPPPACPSLSQQDQARCIAVTDRYQGKPDFLNGLPTT